MVNIKAALRVTATTKPRYSKGMTNVISALVVKTPIKPTTKPTIGETHVPIQSLRRAKRRNPSEKKNITQNHPQKFA